jgi:hypothetical protein
MLNLNTVLATCDYQIFLILNPTIVISSKNVIPSAKIHCSDSTTVYFSEKECNAVSPISSCVIQANSNECIGDSFSAPSESGYYTYVACIDKNGDGKFEKINGEISEVILTVTKCISTDTSSKFPLGDNPDIKGVTFCPDKDNEDTCLDNNRLKEHYCSSTDITKAQCEFRTIPCNHWVNTECDIENGKCYCVGDVNGDGKINIVDFVLIAKSFYSESTDNPTTPGDETRNWNPITDLDRNGKIDLNDIVIAALRFGKDCNIERNDVPLGLGNYNVFVIFITLLVMVLFFGSVKIFSMRR